MSFFFRSRSVYHLLCCFPGGQRKLCSNAKFLKVMKFVDNPIEVGRNLSFYLSFLVNLVLLEGRHEKNKSFK